MTKSIVGRKVRLASSLRARMCSGHKSTRPAAMRETANAIFSGHQLGWTKNAAAGIVSVIAANQKFGLSDASSKAVNTVAIPQMRAAGRLGFKKENATN